MPHAICPWWLGYFLINPLRRLIQNPEKLLQPFIKQDMTVLDVGPGMGYFTIPMAGLVGPKGKVVAVDLQQKMLDSLMRRARKAGVADRIDARLCTENSLNLEPYEGKVDFALAFAMVHEVDDKAALLGQINRTLRSGGRLLISEPKLHVSEAAFEKTAIVARQAGFEVADRPRITWSRSAILTKR